LKSYGRTAAYALRAMEGDMMSEKLEKARAFIEAECVKVASAQNLCRELKHVRIRRLFPKCTAGNWEAAEFDPPYRRSANVWRKRRLAHSLRAMRWLTGE
jgi:hypothetical protein